eukprot:6775498-Prymnesium_polylepis.1
MRMRLRLGCSTSAISFTWPAPPVSPSPGATAAAARSGGGCDTRFCRPRSALTRGEGPARGDVVRYSAWSETHTYLYTNQQLAQTGRT